ncbi:EamA family transporter RarD [Geomonas paludis]|uniref:Chloramphenicol resistance permease RarD n=1 Tax=Geomonas paludis TaxID=2740185 RepID=A0A6V8MTW1_9BACT|nr:EamA family transporter RarD [Geomonas paludis]UPU37941.1 EamA family transporter RarD [Geomonas paludis]GFO63540.1 chloramphenicol resistance permease RarD [Geomonas paludis]
MSTTTEHTELTAAQKSRQGVIYGLAAYLCWGFFPVYFKSVKVVPPLEMVSHRIVWSLAFLVLLLTWKGVWPATIEVLKRPKALAVLFVTTILIATNWLVFIYAISVGEVLQSSLGYFINPLVNVLLGFLFLRERLERPQWISLALAFTGVLYLAIQYGNVPWISLLLALSFGLYALIRKVLHVEPLVGLTVETLLLMPFALFYLVQLNQKGTGIFLTHGIALDVLIPMSGIVTAIPLLLFAAAGKKLRLATIGFLQYITPTMHFLLAITLFGETFTHTHLISFLFIWAGLALYSLHAYRSLRA